jgi:hypothetical protein
MNPGGVLQRWLNTQACHFRRAHEEQERVNKRMSATIDRSSISPVGSMPDSSDEEETAKAEGELVWEGVKDGNML